MQASLYIENNHLKNGGKIFFRKDYLSGFGIYYIEKDKNIKEKNMLLIHLNS